MNLYEEVSEGNKDDEDDDTSNATGSQDEPCTISYCNATGFFFELPKAC